VEVRLLDHQLQTIEVDDYAREMNVHRDVHRFLPYLVLTGWMTMLRFRLLGAGKAGPDPVIGPYMWLDVTNMKNGRVFCRAVVLTGLLSGECDDIKPILTNC
jgi:hypothetical protein